MNVYRLTVLNTGLLLGFSFVAGCGLTPKSNSKAVQSDQIQQQQQAPLKQLSPELAAEACLATARQLEEKNRPHDAIVQYERARSHQPNRPGLAHRLAVLYDRMGDTEAALKEYQIALRETPSNPDLLNDLGYFHFQRQQFADAEANFRKAVEQDPDHQRAWTNLGLTLGSQHRYDDAEAAFQKAGSPAFAKHNLGIVYARQGEYEKAHGLFMESKQLDPMLKQPEAVLNWLDANSETLGTARVSSSSP